MQPRLGAVVKDQPWVGRYVDWLVGWVVDWLIGWLVGCLVGWVVLCDSALAFMTTIEAKGLKGPPSRPFRSPLWPRCVPWRRPSTRSAVRKP